MDAHESSFAKLPLVPRLPLPGWIGFRLNSGWCHVFLNRLAWRLLACINVVAAGVPTKECTQRDRVANGGNTLSSVNQFFAG